MPKLNIADCELTVREESGRFGFWGEDIGRALGGRLLGAAVYEMQAGETNWPYHFHHGVEEWLYVISGAPVLREQTGLRALAPGELIAFAAGPAGSHTVAGPGRVVIFSAGAEGWGTANASVYPDSDKISVAGMMFRRADALEAWAADAPEPGTRQAQDPLGAATGTGGPCPSVDLTAFDPAPLAGRLGSRTWAATLSQLAPGETVPYHYTNRREEWALVVSGALTLRHPDGEDALAPHDVVSFPDGPAGARGLSNDGSQPARLLIITTPVGTPMSEVHPDDGTVVVRISDRDGFRFRLADRIKDYWDGEPDALSEPASRWP